jgi:hypothetical protein
MDDDKGYNGGADSKEPNGQTGPSEDRVSVESDPFSDLGFSTFILSLSTSALVHLAELPDPISNEKKINLPLAKQTIAIIEMLQEKTRGNLNQEEEQLMEDLLYDLRLKYVQVAAK